MAQWLGGFGHQVVVAVRRARAFQWCHRDPAGQVQQPRQDTHVDRFSLVRFGIHLAEVWVTNNDPTREVTP